MAGFEAKVITVAPEKKKKGKKKKKAAKKNNDAVMTEKPPVESSNEEKGGGNCCQNFAAAFQSKVIGGIERGFQRYGEFVARHHWKVVLASFLFACLCTTFMFFMYEDESDQLKLWLPSGSDFERHSLLLDREFADDDSTRQMSLLVAAKDGGNVLTKDNMVRIFKLRQQVADLVGKGTDNTWPNRCEMKVTSTGGVAGMVGLSFPDEVCAAIANQEDAEADADKVCDEQHVFELWAANRTFDDTLTTLEGLSDQDILDAINADDAVSGLTGDALSPDAFLGVAEEDKQDGKILRAQAMKLHFTITGFEEDEDADEPSQLEEDVLAFEEKFIEAFRDKEVDSVLELYPQAVRSSDDIINEANESDQQLFIVGYLLVAIYVMVMLGRFNRVEQRIYLALCGITAVLLGIGTSYGLCSLFGIWGSQMNIIMPFMLLGIGIDDMFVIVQNFDTLDEEEKHLPRTKRIGLAMKHGGVAITITTVTDLLAFGIGATTVLPALSHFCLYATFGIFFVYFFMCTFFFGCFVLDVIRSEDFRDACCCCIRTPDFKPNSCSQRSLLTEAFRFYATYLIKMPCRIIALVITLIFLGLSIYGMTQLEAEFDANIFIPPDTYLRDYFEKSDELFPSGGMFGSVYVVNVTDVHSKMDIAKELGVKLSEDTDLASFSGTSGFHISFEKFVDTALGESAGYPETALEKDPFYSILSAYIWTSGQSMRDQLRFKTEPQCSAQAPELTLFSIPYQHKKYADTAENIEQVNAMYDFVDEFRTKFGVTGDSEEIGDADVFPMSGGYFDYITMEIITVELYRNIGLALLCVFIATLFLIADLFASIIVVVSVSCALVDLLGFMYFWGLSIDTVAAILVTIALGLSVDYSAHIAHAFMVATGTRAERVYTALVDIGPAVLNGGFSTFLAFAMLMTSTSNIFLTFFKIFFLVVFFGLFHGLVFLPVVLTFIGPKSSTQEGHGHGHDAKVAPAEIRQVQSARSVRAKSAFSRTSIIVDPEM